MNAGNSQAKYPTVNVENPAGISVKDMLLNAVQNAEGQLELLESHLSIVRERYPKCESESGCTCPSTAPYFVDIHEATVRINAVCSRMAELVDEIKF